MANELRFKTARDLFMACPAVSRDMVALPTEQPSIEFCRALLAGRVPEEAITFCAYLLPERAAVWWAHECLSHLTVLLDRRDQELLALVRDWVSEPDSAHHRAEVSQAAAIPPTTPAAWIALAAGRHGNGSAMEAPAVSALQPLPAAHAVSAGVLAGLARVALEDRFSVLSAFVEMGIQMAEIEALRQSADAN
ncbi:MULTISPECIES: hypothetical protein [unclassified Mesorhizobium]|uniref:DUF6931 family protein n=1 Tax=unclassified Mesorhizobium TaxID=325217 RepID=UPI000FD2B308|nr:MULTISPECIES: hypothetical protein [unclassified Mesorhizobium]RUV89529.1 hypothetical protein EOA88_13280 [Mesorhizobium sp. M5C.F.Ca.IN.020.14.1.1]RUV30102.1 hypothetical protein EOA86_12590 [Mesorhizobium sp. M5C.F.Ca.IN.020.32.2.1]RWC35228.1 MAG: hypothetical protein EOS70_09115 [Mesorhizobium sp.]RWG51699.1 MAG: hypothetical protein EOQ62_00025 [Mesorhizobium sp.]RWH44994.1 MAG: hypothetical protein EOQ80_20175 [Mesorhizobium sp.]